jgi:protocatechuate 3,4-dioxygenase beta subunit
MDAVTYADANGAFAFGGVPAGNYFLCARVKGYDRACFGGVSEPGRPLPKLMVQAGQNRQDIILSALPLGSVSGTVLDSDGDPVPNAQVQMLRPVYERRKLEWEPVNNAQTNDRGEYRMSYVRPGHYRVMATRQYMPVNRVQPDVTNGQKMIEELYSRQFYPNAATIDAAATLTLKAGNDLKTIDFSLNPVERAVVSGRIILPPGAASNEPVRLLLLPDRPTEQIGAGAGPPDYRFEFPSALPGPQQLLALLKTDDHTYFASESIVAGNGTEDLAVTLAAGTPLSGRLQLEGQGAKEHGPYTVHLTPGDHMRFLGEQPTAEVNDDGTFEFDDVVPGVWDIGVQPEPPGSYIKSMRLGKQDVLTEDMTLKPGTREPLNIVLSLNGAIVSGTVSESASPSAKAAGRVMVLLAPYGKFDDVLSFYQTKPTDENGKFTFKQVTPGRYKIYAFDRMERDEYWNPDFLKPYATMGEEFDVPEGGRLDRKATLIVRGEGGDQ